MFQILNFCESVHFNFSQYMVYNLQNERKGLDGKFFSKIIKLNVAEIRSFDQSEYIPEKNIQESDNK